SFLNDTLLALQHLFRIGRAMSVSWFAGAVAFISTNDKSTGNLRAAIALKAWTELHRQIKVEQSESEDSEDDVDPWDLKNKLGSLTIAAPESDCRPPLPDYSKVTTIGYPDGLECPPAFVVEVDELPRGAGIEWQAMGLAGCDKLLQATSRHSNPATVPPTRRLWDLTCAKHTGQYFVWIALQYNYRHYEGTIRCALNRALAGQIPEHKLEEVLERDVHYTMYTTQKVDFRWMEEGRAIVVPCRRIWHAGKEQIFAVVLARICYEPKLDTWEDP
ncbi:hypothetical protein LTS18_009073, partial [Coniosporium uncinatum]